MEVTEHRLKLFMELYKEQFGQELSRAEAHESLYSLLRLVKCLINADDPGNMFE